MIKNCNVLINNEAVAVIDYDGIKVQIPPIHKKAKTVKVMHKNGRYIVVSDNQSEIADEHAAKPKSKASKKTTIYESAKEIPDITDESQTDNE